MSRKEDEEIDRIMREDAQRRREFDAKVADNLNNATENDTDILRGPEATAANIAYDMEAYSADFDGTDPTYDPENMEDHARLVASVQRWLDNRDPPAVQC